MGMVESGIFNIVFLLMMTILLFTGSKMCKFLVEIPIGSLEEK